MAGLKISSYNPSDMTLISADATGIDFGEVIIGQHNAEAVAILPVADGITFTALALFLENANGVDHSQFGKFKSSEAVQGILPGSDYLSDSFIPVTGISDASMIGVYSDFGIVYDSTTPEYSWLDVEAGSAEDAIGNSTVNFRFIFEYY
jgi:hypothetical protein